MKIFNFRPGMSFHLFLNDTFVKATLGLAFQEKSIGLGNSTQKLDMLFSGCRSLGSDEIMILSLYSISDENTNFTHEGNP